MAGSSRGSVVAAIAGNSVVMVAKFVAFAFTGSGTMLSEGIHSFADVLNQLLLYVGIERSNRVADREHPYGYGAERYVWALMSAVGIFFLGCGVTVYHGITSLFHPEPLSNLPVAVGVLFLALAIEGGVLWIAWRQLRAEAAGRPFVPFLRREADPTAVAVLLEDAVACVGVLVALSALLLTRVTGQLYWDSIGSIVIGLLLGGVAVFLIVRNRASLVGQAIPLEKRDKIRRILNEHPLVERIVVMRSRVIDPETYRIQAEVEFDGRAVAERMTGELREAYDSIDSFEAFQRFAADYAERVTDLIGDEVDEIEARIRREVPRAHHVDIESD